MDQDKDGPGRPFGIGGSDVAAALGLSPYRTPMQLWHELLSRDLDRPGRGAAALHLRFGQHAEPFLAEEYERCTGLRTRAHAQTLRHPRHGFMFGHVDRLVYAGAAKDKDGAEGANGAFGTDRAGAQNEQPTAVLECKTASAFSRQGWGTAGTDQVPTQYLLQCVWYMALTGCPRAELAVLIGNNDFRIYSVARDLQLEEAVIERVGRFWNDHVIAKTPPKALRPEDASIAWPQERAGASVQASEEIAGALELYRHHSALASQAERECERLRAQIMSFMGSAERLTVGGHTVATWRSSSPSLRLDARQLAQEHPQLAAAYSTHSPGARRFLLKEPR